MFQTFSNAALTKAPFPDLAGAGSQFWGYVIHPFDLPWFHVPWRPAKLHQRWPGQNAPPLLAA